MADVMLINPSSKRILKNAGDRMPLGILYLSSILKQRNHRVRVRDMDHLSEKDLLTEVQFDKPEYIGISVYTSPLFKESVDLAKKLKGKAKLIAGGYHATAMPESLFPYFDCVVLGEGEYALPSIVENSIEGLGNKCMVSCNKMSIEEIPHPDRDSLNPDRYVFKQDDRLATTMLTSRGCPNACYFCGNMNKKIRFHDNEFVLEEIKSLKEKGYNDFYFYDDAFTSNKKRTLSLLDRIKDLKINYRITTRAKSLDEEVIRTLKDSGCSWVSMGIESGSDKVLQAVAKNMTTSDNEKAVELLHEQGIKVKGFFMFGMPEEKIYDAFTTIDFAKKLKRKGLTTADFYIMTPFPGTPIWDDPFKYGIEIIDRDYTKYLEAGITSPKAFHTNGYMKPDTIEFVRNEAEKEFKYA